MVGPPSQDETRESMNLLKIAVVTLVGLSAGLITVSGGGSAIQVAAAVLGGLVVGAGLLAYLVRIA
jgi:hypothetical protein